MLTVYGRKSSFNVQKVMWLVGELNVTHRHIEMGGAFGGLDTTEFRALNPHARVPVIVDGDVTVWESHAILRYLAARYGDGRFWNDDPAVRSQWERWMDWAHTTLQPDFLTGVFWGFYRTPAQQRNMAAVEEKIRRCAAHFQLLDTVLADRAFLLGDRLTLADIPAGTHLYRYFNIDISRPRLPNVERWYRTLAKRPAYRAHVMVKFAELYGRLEY
jgi:glutathione S-transferase